MKKKEVYWDGEKEVNYEMVEKMIRERCEKFEDQKLAAAIQIRVEQQFRKAWSSASQFQKGMIYAMVRDSLDQIPYNEKIAQGINVSIEMLEQLRQNVHNLCKTMGVETVRPPDEPPKKDDEETKEDGSRDDDRAG